MTPDPAERQGSDGLVQGDSRHVLQQLADYRDAGHSTQRIRRDFALSPDVTTSQIHGAAEVGRRLRAVGGDWGQVGHAPAPKRFFGGIDRLPSRAEWEAQQRAKEEERHARP